MDNAANTETSRRIVFSCLEKYPHPNKNLALEIAQDYFMTDGEYIDQLQKRIFRPTPPPTMILLF